MPFILETGGLFLSLQTIRASRGLLGGLLVWGAQRRGPHTAPGAPMGTTEDF